ncbi:MAG: tRNA(Ile)-lysidine synthetase, partial [Actinobacteria bacterium]
AFAEAVETGERLLLGHTMNDQAETLLLNLLRGAGTRGLAGMPYHRPPNIYRPLLGVRRSETRELAALAGLPFVDDPTNADQRLRRNRLRLDIMPRLEELNPGVVEGLARTAEHVRADADHLDAEASRVANLLVGDSEARVAAASLIVLDSPIRARVLSAMVGSLREQPHLTSDEIGRVEQVLLGQTAAAQIEGQIRVERDGPHLVCRVEG